MDGGAGLREGDNDDARLRKKSEKNHKRKEKTLQTAKDAAEGRNQALFPCHDTQ